MFSQHIWSLSPAIYHSPPALSQVVDGALPLSWKVGLREAGHREQVLDVCGWRDANWLTALLRIQLAESQEGESASMAAVPPSSLQLMSVLLPQGSMGPRQCFAHSRCELSNLFLLSRPA